MEPVVHGLERLIGGYGYVGIFVLSLASSACIPFPSEVTMLVGGWYAAQGRLNFLVVGLLGVAGNLLGSLIAYGVGRWKGRPFLERYGRFVLLRPHEIDRAEQWWNRHGEAATFFGRLIPLVRTFISLPAGIAKMPLGRFLIYTVLGIIPWTFGLAWLGYVVEDRWRDMLKYFDWPAIVVAVVLVVAAGTWFVKRRRATTDAGEA